MPHPMINFQREIEFNFWQSNWYSLIVASIFSQGTLDRQLDIYETLTIVFVTGNYTLKSSETVNLRIRVAHIGVSYTFYINTLIYQEEAT